MHWWAQLAKKIDPKCTSKKTLIGNESVICEHRKVAKKWQSHCQHEWVCQIFNKKWFFSGKLQKAFIKCNSINSQFNEPNIADYFITSRRVFSKLFMTILRTSNIHIGLLHNHLMIILSSTYEHHRISWTSYALMNISWSYEHLMISWTSYDLMNILCSYEHFMILWTSYDLMNILLSCEHLMILWTSYDHLMTI
jgi:hypothetical protein